MGTMMLHEPIVGTRGAGGIVQPSEAWKVRMRRCQQEAPLLLARRAMALVDWPNGCSAQSGGAIGQRSAYRLLALTPTTWHTSTSP